MYIHVLRPHCNNYHLHTQYCVGTPQVQATWVCIHCANTTRYFLRSVVRPRSSGGKQSSEVQRARRAWHRLGGICPAGGRDWHDRFHPIPTRFHSAVERRRSLTQREWVPWRVRHLIVLPLRMRGARVALGAALGGARRGGAEEKSIMSSPVSCPVCSGHKHGHWKLQWSSTSGSLVASSECDTPTTPALPGTRRLSSSAGFVERTMMHGAPPLAGRK